MRWLAALCAAGCGVAAQETSSLPLEVGQLGDDGVFQPLDGQIDVPIELISNGTALAYVALRAETPPEQAEVAVMVSVGGVMIGGALVPQAAAFEPTAEGVLLRDFRLVFTSMPCCIVCHEADVSVEIRDEDAQIWSGDGRTRFVRGSCPDVSVCCQTVDECPSPELAQVCE